MFASTNGRLACLPFVAEKEDSAKQKGFATNKRSTTLIKTNVLLADDKGKYKVGDLVYLRPDVLGHAWVKEVYDLDIFVNQVQIGPVIFIPEEFIVLRSQGAS